MRISDWSSDVCSSDLLSRQESADFDAEKLRAQVREARTQGYAYTSGERVPGASAIAAQLRDHTGFARYALAVTGPSFRLDDRSDAFRDVLLNGAGRISSMTRWTEQRTRTRAPPDKMPENK